MALNVEEIVADGHADIRHHIADKAVGRPHIGMKAVSADLHDDRLLT